MKLTIGVMGSSGGKLSADLRKEIFRLGERSRNRTPFRSPEVAPAYPTRRCVAQKPRLA